MKYQRLRIATTPIKVNVLFYDQMGRYINTVSQLPLYYDEDQLITFWNSPLSDTNVIGSKIINELIIQNLLPKEFENGIIQQYDKNGDINYIGFTDGSYINFVITGGW